MKVEGSRLLITCKNCGRDVVAVGDSPGKAASIPSTVSVSESSEEAVAAKVQARRELHGMFELEEGEIKEAAPKPLPVAPEQPASPAPDMSPESAQLREGERAASGSMERVKDAGREQELPSREPDLAAAKESGSGRSSGKIAGVAIPVLLLAVAGYFFVSSKRPAGGGETSLALPPAPVATGAVPSAPEATPLTEKVPIPTAVTTARPAETAVSAIAVKTPFPVPTKAAGPAVMSEVDALASGAVDADAFRDRTGKMITHIRMCGRLELAREGGSPPAAVTVALLVAPSGSISQVKLDGGIEGSPLASCIKSQLQQLTFPPYSGRPFEVRRTVDLGSGGEKK